MGRRELVASPSAVAAAFIYRALTSVAIHFYPKPYGPLTNWLSDLGNPSQNPSGAVYYNVGGLL